MFGLSCGKTEPGPVSLEIAESLLTKTPEPTPEPVLAPNAGIGLQKEGKKEEFVQTYLQGVLRYYSDEKIEGSLEALLPDYPDAQAMLDEYKALEELRDSSGADEASIEKLAKAKNSDQYSVFLPVIEDILRSGVTVEQEAFIEQYQSGCV